MNSWAIYNKNVFHPAERRHKKIHDFFSVGYLTPITHPLCLWDFSSVGVQPQ